jgi:hypothetical protein
LCRRPPRGSGGNALGHALTIYLLTELRGRLTDKLSSPSVLKSIWDGWRFLGQKAIAVREQLTPERPGSGPELEESVNPLYSVMVSFALGAAGPANSIECPLLQY